MRRTYSAGGVILNDKNEVIVVSQHGRSWSLPKGHMEQGESALEDAYREIKEESGVSELTFIKELGTYEREKMDSENKDDKEELKIITIFLFTTKQKQLKPIDPENPEAKWVPIEKVAPLLTHPIDKAFFKKVTPKIRTYLKTRK